MTRATRVGTGPLHGREERSCRHLAGVKPGSAGEGACEVHNPAYDFNDAAIPLGSAFFVRAVERKLAKA